MSAAKENSCRKFQANIFNKSKCQNCFKPRELHLLTDQDLTQAKPIYGGWLCLAPEGTDFDNPMQRSRKWQRRFFVLYEHGCLRFALDESPSTLPQGTVNMNLCTDVIDAEPKTGQKNALCIITPDQEYFIRGENKEIINGWSEQLVVYPRTNKQNQKKKRKVEPTTSQEPGPAKVAVTGSGIPEAEKVPDSSSIIWQEELNQREAEGAAVWSAADLPPLGSPLRSGVIEKLEALELENAERMEVEEAGRSGARQGRSEHRRFHREVTAAVFLSFLSTRQWKKYWFVLTDHSLRYYKDSIAEEASDLDGEIDLSTCYNVTEYQAQRNYGFQIHTQEGVHTLSAMTAGIRRNWIQAVMKNVRPSTAPDVARSEESLQHCSSSVERDSAPGLKKSRARERRREGRSKTFDWAEFRPIAQAMAQQRAQEAEGLQANLGELERSRRREERRKRYESVTGTSVESPLIAEIGRMDYESGEGDGHTGLDSGGPLSLERQQRVEEVIEQHWQQVENTPIREERRVPLIVLNSIIFFCSLNKPLCHQQLVDSNQQKQELEFQLRTALEREQDIRTGYISPVTSLCVPCCVLTNCLVPFSKLEHPMGLEADVTPQTKRPELVSSQAQSLTKKYQETKELLQLQELKKRNMQAQLGLSLSHLSTEEPYFSEPQKTSIVENPPPEPVQKTVSFLLQDSSERIQELEDLIIGKPLTLRELMKLLRTHSCNQEIAEKGQFQKLLETWKYQQEVENETIKKSLARAGESIRDYEARLLTMEDMVGKVQMQNLESLKNPYGPLSKIENHSETNEMNIGLLSQRVELLTSENGALNQRCQEIVNQLTEADREIDRLKAELINLQSGKQHSVAVEELNRLKAELAENQANAIDREYYERELNEKSLRLHEALVTLEELGNTLKDTEKKLQLKEATLKGLGFQVASCEDNESQQEKEQLRELLEASQAKLYEREANLQSREQRCLELEAENSELIACNEESERVSSQKLKEAENEIRMLRERLEVEMKAGRVEKRVHADGGLIQLCEKQVADEGLIEQVVEEIEMKSEALNQVLEMLTKIDVNVEKTLSNLKSTLLVPDYLGSSKEDPLCVSQKDMDTLILEGEFWSQLLSTAEMRPQENKGESCERRLAEHMMAEKSMMLLIRGICPRAKVEVDSEMVVTEPDLSRMYSWPDNQTNTLILKDLTETLEAKVYFLKQTVSTLKLSKHEKLLSLAQLTFHSANEQKQRLEYLLEALREACMSYVIIRQKFQHEKELTQKQAEIQAGSSGCVNCSKLRDLNRDLQTKLADLQNQLSGVQLRNDRPQTFIQIDGEPIDSLDKTIELQDMIARHRKELREVRDVYEQEAEKLRQEVAKASETLRLRSEENVKEIDSLTICMENLKKKHEMERNILTEKFYREMEELRNVVTRASPDRNSSDEAKDRQAPPASSPTSNLKERIQELVTQVSVMTEEMRRREEQGDVTTLRLKYEKDLENLKATCERGFAAMEESHQKVIDELQRKHQRELENLQEEKERLLAEETAATIAAIEAMKNAHRTELEKELDKARKANNNAENADIEEIRRQHEEELCSFQREIEVLSEQYSQKCLENAHLAQALEAERQALRQCQRENQELNAHNQELNNRLAAEITKMRSMTSEDGGGDPSATIQGKELYELEVMLRVKESEVQYLKQEINSLKDELQAAQRDKKYATDKYKDIYTELSIVKAKAERDLGRLRDQLQLAHEALGEPSLEEVERGGYDIMKSKSNPDILKMAAAAAKRSERTMRSKVGSSAAGRVF
uniref:Myosin phosphatase Rho interacting protein n=1 Tax=Myripristis murdjan TaxID=586833 RepID=A0A668A6V9_9TELE